MEPEHNPGFQRVTDGRSSAVFLWMFPRWVRPNHLTIARFILIPVVLAAPRPTSSGGPWECSSSPPAPTSSMGRWPARATRSPSLGTYIDPIADKLLVAAVLAWVAGSTTS